MSSEKPKQATGAKPQATDAKPQATGAKGFAFETRIGTTLDLLKEQMENEEGWVCIIHSEQGIREFFKEQSLNGVDHMVQIQDPQGKQYLFLLQEKWKLMTNQREVSQFLDCCARILARMPDYKGSVHRLWVSRTVPTLNGEKSLEEGQAIVVQTCTSQTFLCYMSVVVIAEVLGRRDLCNGLIDQLEGWLPQDDEVVTQEVIASTAQPSQAATTFSPVSDFGEKRVLPITKKTQVKISKME
jgi:hypothetical protein